MLKKIAFAGVGLALLASPLLTSADTISDLQAQIQALVAQIAALQGQTKPVAPTPPLQPDDYGTGTTVGNYCPNLSITMRKGSRDATTGGQVIDLQTFLAGYYDLPEEGLVTGYFGRNTEAAVIRFQKQYSLPAFGIVGSLTRAKIGQVCGGGTKPELPNCPQYMPAQCPAGQHNEYGPVTTNERGCQILNARCVPDTTNDTNGFPSLTFSAQPVTESAFNFTFDPGRWTYYGYKIDYGDGETMPLCSEQQGCVRGGTQTTHGFTTPGQHTVTLYAIKMGVPSVARTLSITSSGNPTTNDANSVRITQPAAGSVFKQDSYIPVTVTGSVSRKAYGNIMVYQKVNGNWTALPSMWPINTTNSFVGPGQFTVNVPNVIFGSNTSLTWPTPPGEWGLSAEMYTYGCGGYDCSPPIDRNLAKSAIVPITITSVGGDTRPTSITVTAPNGGESWQIGSQNTITWAPYQYGPDINPSKDVTAYLERYLGEKENGEKVFETLGKVVEDGRASIHWSGMIDQWNNFATPGTSYYIRVVNNVTGATDRSNAPFTLTRSEAVDLVIDGQQGPINAGAEYAGTHLLVWNSSAQQSIRACRFVSNIAGADVLEDRDWSHTGSARIEFWPIWAAGLNGQRGFISISCTLTTGEVIRDEISFIPTGVVLPKASLQVTSPNGGEQLSIDQPFNIKWVEKGLQSASVALYKNDQWYAWLLKDAPSSTYVTDEKSMTWYPSSSNVSSADGNVYKIYITAKKSDGTGYVDDKSDAPFSFIPAAANYGVVVVTDPNAGTTWTLSADQNTPTNISVSFNASNLPKNPVVWFNLVDQQSGVVTPLGMTRSAVVNGANTFTTTLYRPNGGYDLTSGRTYKLQSILSNIPYSTWTKPYVSGCVPTETSWTSAKCGADQVPGTIISVAESASFRIGIGNTNSDGTLSPWGKKLGIRDENIPNGQFRRVNLKRNGDQLEATLPAQVVTDEPYFNYNNGGGMGSAKIGAYFVGKFTYGNPSPPIEFDMSNPQWSVARLYVDGQLANTYGGNSGSPTYSRVFNGGTHVIEIEYESNWHAGTFAARIGRIVSPSQYVGAGTISSVLNQIEQQVGAFNVAAASVYESGDDTKGGIQLSLPALSGPTVLVLSSYDPVLWHWGPTNDNMSKIKAIVVYSFAGAAAADLAGSIPVYRIRGTYIGDGNGGMTPAQVAQKIGRPVDSFATAYDPTSLTLPPFPPKPPVVTLGTYRGYLNGDLFITTANISQSDALANCKLNAGNNPTSSIRCTWNDIEIYNAPAAPTEYPYMNDAAKVSTNSNLANALTALESALKALIGKLGQ